MSCFVIDRFKSVVRKKKRDTLNVFLDRLILPSTCKSSKSNALTKKRTWF